MTGKTAAAAALLSFLLLPTRAPAQAVSGTILGSVKDVSGAAVAQCTGGPSPAWRTASAAPR